MFNLLQILQGFINLVCLLYQISLEVSSSEHYLLFLVSLFLPLFCLLYHIDDVEGRAYLLDNAPMYDLAFNGRRERAAL